jgi:arsenate reductase
VLRDDSGESGNAVVETCGLLQLTPEDRSMAEPVRPLNVLFLCTGNSARSIIAESILRREGGGRTHAYSAGSHPIGRVNPRAIEVLQQNGFPIDDLRSKSWGEFEKPGAPRLDVVITVCDDAARETCPIWPGQPVTAHWGVADPAAIEGRGADQVAAFRRAFQLLLTRIRRFTSLPLDTLDRASLRSSLRDIGQVI